MGAAAMTFGTSLHHAIGANFTWSGLGADDNWLTGNNWVGTLAPSGTGANLDFTGTVQLSNFNNNTAGTQFTSINFQTGAGAFMLTGNALSLVASSVPVVTDASTSLETIDIPLTVGSGRTIEASAGTLSLAGGLSGTSGVEFGNNPGQLNQPAATGIVLLNSAANYTTGSSSTAATSVFSGTLQVGAGGSLPTTDAGGSANGWVALGSAGNATNNVPSSAGFLVLGDATTPINQTISFLRVNSNSAAGSSVYGGNSATSTLTINNLQTSTDSFPGNLGGATGNENNLALIITGNTVALSGVNTYNGGTTIASGTLQTASGTALPNGGNLTFGDASNDSGTLDLDGHTSTVGLISIVGSGTGNKIGNGSTSTASTTGSLVYAGGATPSTFSGTIVNNFGATGQIGTTSLRTLSGTLSLTNPNTYSGGTTVSGGTLVFSPQSLGSGVVILDGGILQYAAGNTQDISTQTVEFGINGGTIDTNGNNVTYADPVGAVATGPLTKAGAGTLTLAAGSAYTTNTTVTGGTLLIDNTFNSATVTLDGGNLASGPSATLIGNVVAGAHAHTIAPGGIGSIGTLTIGGLTSSSLTTLAFDLGTGSGLVTNGDNLILGSGTTSIGAGTLLTFGGAAPVAGNDYQLIGDTSSGAVVGAIPLGNFTLPAAPAGLAYSLAVSSGFIDLDVTNAGPAALTWDNAAATGLWSTSNSDANWNNGTANAPYSDGSNVIFNDNNGGAGNYSVTLNQVVNPGSITVNNSAGNYTISGAGSIAGTASLTKNGTGVFTINTKGTSLGAVTVNGGSVQLGTSSGVASMTSLSVGASGTFDVNNNHVIINYGSGADPISSIAALLKTGYNGGNWNGVGGIISTAAQLNNATAGNLLYGLGYADSADAGNPAGLASGTIEIKYTLLGDANLDGVVDGTDFGILAANFNKGVTGWDQGDFDYDNVVDGSDFGFMAANFNKGASGAAAWQAVEAFAAANGLLADVPEPASIGLIGIMGAGLLTRRRAKCK